MVIALIFSISGSKVPGVEAEDLYRSPRTIDLAVSASHSQVPCLGVGLAARTAMPRSTLVHPEIRGRFDRVLPSGVMATPADLRPAAGWDGFYPNRGLGHPQEREAIRGQADGAEVPGA